MIIYSPFFLNLFTSNFRVCWLWVWSYIFWVRSSLWKKKKIFFNITCTLILDTTLPRIHHTLYGIIWYFVKYIISPEKCHFWKFTGKQKNIFENYSWRHAAKYWITYISLSKIRSLMHTKLFPGVAHLFPNFVLMSI